MNEQISAWRDEFKSLLQSGFHDPSLFLHTTRRSPVSSTLFRDHSASSTSVSQYLEHVSIVGQEFPPEANDVLRQWEIVSPGTLIAFRGCMRLTQLHDLGLKLQLIPEVLLDHLIAPRSFRQQTLPSQRRQSIVIWVISLGTHQRPIDFAKRPAVQQQSMDHKVDEHNRNIYTRDVAGVEQCRRVNLHGSRFFSVEQRITFYPYLTGAHSWSGIVLNDCGVRSEGSPWINQGYKSSAHFYPLNRSGPGSLNEAFISDDLLETFPAVRHPDPCQSRIDGCDLMDTADRRICTKDTFMFLADILRTSVHSWSKFLGFLREWHQHLEGNAEDKAEILRHDKQVLDRAIQHFSDVIHIIQNKSDLGWTTASQTDDRERVKKVAWDLERDFVHLHLEAKDLSEQCKDSINMQMTTISIQDARRGLEQADRVRILTFLAYIFIPSAFISSCFGMNVVQVSNAPLSRFLYCVIPFTAAFCLIPWFRELKVLILSCYSMCKRVLNT